MNGTTSTKDRHASGRFAAGNAGGPGNPFARMTARRKVPTLIN